MLTRFFCEGWKNLPAIDTGPLGRLSVVVGEPDSGKTNLFEAIASFLNLADPTKLGSAPRVRGTAWQTGKGTTGYKDSETKQIVLAGEMRDFWIPYQKYLPSGTPEKEETPECDILLSLEIDAGLHWRVSGRSWIKSEPAGELHRGKLVSVSPREIYDPEMQALFYTAGDFLHLEPIPEMIRTPAADTATPGNVGVFGENLADVLRGMSRSGWDKMSALDGNLRIFFPHTEGVTVDPKDLPGVPFVWNAKNGAVTPHIASGSLLAVTAMLANGIDRELHGLTLLENPDSFLAEDQWHDLAHFLTGGVSHQHIVSTRNDSFASMCRNLGGSVIRLGRTR